MQAQAFALLADCRRMASDLDGARAAIAEAWKWNEEGEGDPLDKAEILRVDAAYAATVGFPRRDDADPWGWSLHRNTMAAWLAF